MVYLTKQTFVAFVAGGLVVAGMIPVVQGVRGLQLDLFDAPAVLFGESLAERNGPKANGTVLTVAQPVSASLERRARAGEPAADIVSPTAPSVALARGRSSGI